MGGLASLPSLTPSAAGPSFFSPLTTHLSVLQHTTPHTTAEHLPSCFYTALPKLRKLILPRLSGLQRVRCLASHYTTDDTQQRIPLNVRYSPAPVTLLFHYSSYRSNVIRPRACHFETPQTRGSHLGPGHCRPQTYRSTLPHRTHYLAEDQGLDSGLP